MRVFLLVADYDNVILASTNKEFMFKKTAEAAKEEANSGSLNHRTYGIKIHNNKTGKEIEHLYFVTDRRDNLFGKIVVEKGTRDEKVVGTWLK